LLHLDDQTMPYYQERVAGQVNNLDQWAQALRRKLHRPDQRPDELRQGELDQLDASLRQIEKKLNQMPGLPEEMRDRVRDEVEAALEEARSRLEILSGPSGDADKR
jgi:hypothetical protein